MTPTKTVKQYSDLAVAQTRTIAEQAKTPLLAFVGAGDLAVERAKPCRARLRSRPTSP
jgi:heparin binding hemagglutinin HbhA